MVYNVACIALFTTNKCQIDPSFQIPAVIVGNMNYLGVALAVQDEYFEVLQESM